MSTTQQIPPFDFALFDAGLTLIHPVSTVEKIYAQYAARSGIPVEELTQQIRRHFGELFGEVRDEMSRGEDGYVWSDEQDRQMWRQVCLGVAERIPGMTDDPERWFTELYDHFGRQTTWRPFDDTRSTLEGLRGRGVRLAVVSNWDSGLPDILKALELDGLLDAVLVSARDGHRKPGARIFELALERLGADPSRTIMVGDSYVDDVQGASRAGITGVLVHRSRRPPPDGIPVIRTLAELLDEPTG